MVDAARCFGSTVHANVKQLYGACHKAEFPVGSQLRVQISDFFMPTRCALGGPRQHGARDAEIITLSRGTLIDGRALAYLGLEVGELAKALRLSLVSTNLI